MMDEFPISREIAGIRSVFLRQTIAIVSRVVDSLTDGAVRIDTRSGSSDRKIDTIKVIVRLGKLLLNTCWLMRIGESESGHRLERMDRLSSRC